MFELNDMFELNQWLEKLELYVSVHVWIETWDDLFVSLDETSIFN